MKIVIDIPDKVYGILKYFESVLDCNYEKGDDIGAVLIKAVLNGAPFAETEQKTGKWEWNKRTGEYECSKCGCNPVYEGMTPDDREIDKYRFCRWCGRKMEVEE